MIHRSITYFVRILFVSTDIILKFRIELLKIIKFIILLVILSTCSYGRPEVRVELTGYKLGTIINLVVYHTDSTFANNKLEAAFGIIDKMDSIFSDYKNSSELNLLSKNSGNNNAIPVSHHLYSLIDTALYISEITDGAFDITCGPLTYIWRTSSVKGRIPSTRKISRKLNYVGYKRVHLNSNDSSIVLTRKGMRLDAGGIAKGYIADVVSKFFKDEGIPIHMIDLGGDIVTGNAPPEREGWSIGIPGEGIIYLSNTAVATSGPDYQFIVYNSQKYSHIIDPRTGWGITDPKTVTVVSKSGSIADGLASAFSVLSISDSLTKLNLFDGTSVYIRENGKEFISEEFPAISY
jgi:thiamine biosynthesis lipoprotein